MRSARYSWIAAAGGALDHQAQHVGVGRGVVEAPAVRLGGGLQRDEAFLQRLRHRVRPLGIPQHGAAVAVEGAAGVEIGFVEVEADRHVEQVAHARARIGAAFRHRDIVGDRRVGIEQAVAGGDAGQHAGDGFRDREDDVRPGRIGIWRVPRRDNLAVAQRDETVGRRLLEMRRRRDPAAGAVVEKRFAQRGIVGGGCLAAGRLADRRRGHDLLDVLEAPAVERRGAPVCERHVAAGKVFAHRMAGPVAGPGRSSRKPGGATRSRAASGCRDRAGQT